MQGEQGLDDALDQQCAVVTTRQVSGFMAGDLLQVVRAHADDQGCGNENGGVERAGGHRDSNLA